MAKLNHPASHDSEDHAMAARHGPEAPCQPVLGGFVDVVSQQLVNPTRGTPLG
jgi:hypothetical protein